MSPGPAVHFLCPCVCVGMGTECWIGELLLGIEKLHSDNLKVLNYYPFNAILNMMYVCTASGNGKNETNY